MKRMMVMVAVALASVMAFSDTVEFLGVSASVNCPDEKTAAEKKGKIIAEFKAKYADRLSPDGGYTLTVATGSDSATGKAYVEVDLETTAFKSILARNNNPAK